MAAAPISHDQIVTNSDILKRKNMTKHHILKGVRPPGVQAFNVQVDTIG